MARCINCNNELKPGNEFCGKCGTANKQIVKSTPGFSCPGCGGNVPEGSTNCTNCGRPVPQTVSFIQTQSIACPSCGAFNYPNTFYCMSCGRPMPTVEEIQKQQIYAARPVSKSKNALILSSVAVVLIITLIVGLWKPGYIWQWLDKDRIVVSEKDNGQNNKGSNSSRTSPDSNQDVSVLSEEWMAEYLASDPGTNPAPMPVSGTKAFKVTPADGLTISAPENALDKDREFTAEKINADKIMDFTEKYVDADWLVLGGYEIDGGINPDERMPGLINVEMDLSKLDIDEVFWEFTHALRIGDDGSVSFLPSNVNGSVLSCQTSQNSIICAVIIGLAAGTGVMHLIERGHEGLDKLYRDKGINFHHIVYKGDYASYDVYWPETLLSAEMKQYYEEIKPIMEKYGLNPNGSLNSAALEATRKFKSGYEMKAYLDGKLKALYSDPEYVEIARKMKDVDFSKKKYWPAEVVQTTNALDLADKYLFGFREFDTPGFDVDIVVLDKWPEGHGKESLGISMNLYTYRPFIHINAGHKNMPRSATEKGTEATSSLILTVTHELFHVVQSKSVTFDSDEYTMFWEALAVSLEKEAFDYFSSEAGKKVINSDHTTVLTDRYYFENLYSRSLLMPFLWNDNGDNKEYLRIHGYEASHWIDFLRDRYYSGRQNDFIPDLVKRFGITSGGKEIFNLILRQQTANVSFSSGSGQPYSRDFIAFCQKNYKDIYSRMQHVTPKIEDIKLNADNPMAEIKMSWQPLSVKMQDFKIDSKGADGKPVEYRLAVKGKLPWAIYYITRNFVDGSNTTTISPDQEIVVLPVSTSSLITLMEIQAQTEEISADEKSATYQVYLLRQPEEPTIEIDEDYLIITPPDWSIPNPRDILSGYDIIITGPGGAEYRHREEVSLYPVEIPLKDIKPKDKSKVSEEGADEYTAYIVERIDMPDGSSVYGPDGKVAKLGDELRFLDIIGKYDMAQNVSNFETPYLDNLISQMEGVEGSEDLIEQYRKSFEGIEGTHTGTLTITKSGEDTAEIGFYTENSQFGGTIFYKGTWDDGVLHLTPSEGILGGGFDLYFKKNKGVVTCQGESNFADQTASYSYTISATKKN
jgi:DNA-directed RNA polymerase subunit RPC12/RpoP